MLQPLLQRSVAQYAGVTTRYSCRLERFDVHPDHVLATLRDVNTQPVTTVRASYLVACDGVTSTVREALGIAMQGTPKLSYSIGITARKPRSGLPPGVYCWRAMRCTPCHRPAAWA
jgi:2-polyprenyl-6-methoxyphenol hydroxylase-like FAD-dependent oxidoreductase